MRDTYFCNDITKGKTTVNRCHQLYHEIYFLMSTRQLMTHMTQQLTPYNLVSHNYLIVFPLSFFSTIYSSHFVSYYMSCNIQLAKKTKKPLLKDCMIDEVNTHNSNTSP